MKKVIFLFVIFVFLVISFDRMAAADEIKPEANAIINQVSDSHGTYINGELMNNYTRGDPSSVFGLQPLQPEKTADTRLPVLLSRYGFVILDDFDEVFQGIRVENLLAGKGNWWDSSENFYPLEAEDTTATENDRVSILPYYPWGVEKVGEAFIAVPKDHSLITPYLYEAIRKVWSQTGCRYYTVMTNMRQITANMGWGAGISLVGSVLPAPDTNGNRTGAVSGTGVGAGKFESFIWQKPGFYVIGWQHYLSGNEARANLARYKSRSAAPAEVPTKAPAAVQKTAAPEKKGTTAVLNWEPLLFEYDSDQLSDAETVKLAKWAKFIVRQKDTLRANQKLVLIGGASIEGTDRHNWDLAGRRAENSALKLAEMLIKGGITTDWIENNLQFQSIGENFLNVKNNGQHPKNRCVYMAVQERIN